MAGFIGADPPALRLEAFPALLDASLRASTVFGPLPFFAAAALFLALVAAAFEAFEEPLAGPVFLAFVSPGVLLASEL